MHDPEQPFLPGQRWVNEAHSELGLGTILSVDARAVQVSYPATGETLMYARRGAPLVRVAFEAGDRIRDRKGRELVVTGRQEHEGLLVYECELLDGSACLLPESGLDDHLSLNHPRDRLLSGRLDRAGWFGLRQQCWKQRARLEGLPVHGLVGARVSPIPHQLYIAAQISARAAPRVLLADEVGLGKTIEAGLILHRQLLSGRIRRVLLVVPQPLLHQWLVEMLRRFNLRFALFDEQRFEAGEADGNPFAEEQLVLCSLDFLTSRREVARAVLDSEWDTLVLDEAHHLAWSEQGASLEYDLVAALAADTPSVLLLTATPEQLGQAGHFGRLRLLDPQRFHDYPAFLDEEARFAPIAEVAGRLLESRPLDDAGQRLLTELLGEEADDEPSRVVQRLVDRHGTGRVLFRNTRSAVSGFPQRSVQAYPLDWPQDYARPGDAAEAMLGYRPEQLHGEGWTAQDPRVDWLAQLLRELRPAKVLLICARADTVLSLREALQQRHGLHAAMFHEAMSIIERDRAAAYFADHEEGSQLLICSEIGSEGRNFQFAHHLVLFDLPLNPDLLEQRIGRLDRIGQTETVQLHVPFLQGSAGQTLYRWYQEGLNAFAAVCPAGTTVAERLAEPLRAALADPERANDLILEARDLSQQLNRELEAGRDRLLELHSHQPEVSAQLVDMLVDEDMDSELRGFMTRLWDSFGVQHEPGPQATAILHPGDHMLHEHFPGLPEDGLTITFDRGHALAHEDRGFLSWEHPMVRGAMDWLSGGAQGSTAMQVIKDPRFRPGTVLLELVFVAECPAPPALSIGRFMPPSAVRLLLDPKGRDLADKVATDELKGQCMTRDRKLAATAIRSQTELLRRLFERGEELAAQAAAQLKQAAAESMLQELEEEEHRLSALAKVNPNVRPEELDHLIDLREQLTRHLDRAYLRLDAARMLVAG